MKKTYLHAQSIVLFILLISSISANAQTPALSVGLAPAVQFPFAIGDVAMPFTMGGSAALDVQYDLNQPSGLFLRGGADYYFNPYTSGNSLSLLAFSVDAGYGFGIFRLNQ